MKHRVSWPTEIHICHETTSWPNRIFDEVTKSLKSKIELLAKMPESMAEWQNAIQQTGSFGAIFRLFAEKRRLRDGLKIVKIWPAYDSE